MNPFDGYIETPMTVEPTAYALEAGAGLNGNDVFRRQHEHGGCGNLRMDGRLGFGADLHHRRADTKSPGAARASTEPIAQTPLAAGTSR